MHSITNARHNVVNHVVTANRAVRRGPSADCIDAASKRQLETKRPTLHSGYRPEPTGAGTMRMPARAGQPRLQRGRRPDRGFTSCGTAGETPAAIWAALVISRALSS
jgi:hypothetical protein